MGTLTFYDSFFVSCIHHPYLIKDPFLKSMQPPLIARFFPLWFDFTDSAFCSFSIPCLISLLWQDFICISAPLMELNFFDAKWALIVFQPVALPTKMDFSSRICIPCDFFFQIFTVQMFMTYVMNIKITRFSHVVGEQFSVTCFT